MQTKKISKNTKHCFPTVLWFRTEKFSVFTCYPMLEYRIRPMQKSFLKQINTPQKKTQKTNKHKKTPVRQKPEKKSPKQQKTSTQHPATKTKCNYIFFPIQTSFYYCLLILRSLWMLRQKIRWLKLVYGVG